MVSIGGKVGYGNEDGTLDKAYSIDQVAYP
jgi:hypothetical protein